MQTSFLFLASNRFAVGVKPCEVAACLGDRVTTQQR